MTVSKDAVRPIPAGYHVGNGLFAAKRGGERNHRGITTCFSDVARSYLSRASEGSRSTLDLLPELDLRLHSILNTERSSMTNGCLRTFSRTSIQRNQ